jgi:hypothetical protein
MRKLLPIFTMMIAISLLTSVALAGDKDTEALSVAGLAAEVVKLEGKECQVTGTIIGACMSGCKMWIADGSYKDGDFFTLVRAKDDAFTFQTDKQGAQVVLTGYVVGKYKDYCADAAEAGHAEPAAGEQVGGCKAPVNVEGATKGELQEMTFFATKVEYVKKTDA